MKHRELTAEAGRLFDEGFGHKAVASRLCVPEGTARNWEYAYRALGKEALLNGRKLSYSQDLKLEAVRLSIEEGMSKPQVMERL